MIPALREALPSQITSKPEDEFDVHIFFRALNDSIFLRLVPLVFLA
jgi:hypothetical protein